MKRLLRAAVTAIVVGALAPAGVQASSTAQAARDAVFSELERQIMERYFGVEKDADETDDESGQDAKSGKDRKDKHKKAKHKSKKKHKGLPPGLAKRDQLPPGLAKRAELPPGLAKRDLPPDLEARLPAPEPGTERKVVEKRVVLLETVTGRVLDILEDIVVGQ